MDKDKIANLINTDKYQVFLLHSACPVPISFASHPWFVINKKGTLSRYGVNHVKNVGEKSWGHLAMNFLPPFVGLPVFLFYPKFHFKAKLLGYVEGDENSLAKEIVDFIENSQNTYPYLNTYHFIGPNSNTYVQWVLNKFPDFRVKLPWNAVGKNYKF